MFRALGARVTLDWRGEDGAGLAEAAAQVAWQWASGGLKTIGALWREIDVTEGAERVRTIRASAGARELFRTILDRPDDSDPSLSWRTTVDIIRRDETVEAGVCVEQDMRHQRVPPSPLQPPLMSLVQQLVQPGAWAGTQRVSSAAYSMIGADGIRELVDEVLLDGGRRLPVLLFTAVKEQDGAYPPSAGDPSLAARELCGLAHVYVVPRAEDTHRLTRRLGMLSAYDGAVRIYWPRFRLTDPPPRHPLHLRQRLNISSSAAIAHRIIDVGARAYRPPEGTDALLALRRRDREQARIAELLAAQPDPANQVAALGEELAGAIDVNVQLEDELETLRGELQRTVERSDELEAAIAELRGMVREQAGETAVDLRGQPGAPPQRAGAGEPSEVDSALD